MEDTTNDIFLLHSIIIHK